MKKNSFFKVELLILIALYSKNCYGYEIAATILTESNDVLDIKEGALYPVLHRLTEAGFISSYEEIVNRKIRVYYHLEKEGKIELMRLINDFETKYEAIMKLIGRINIDELQEEVSS